MQDEQCTRLKGYINTGFPCYKKNLLTDLHEFCPHKEMLSVKSGLITCGKRIIVPREMQHEMLQYIYEGHQGKERCLLWARNTVFWPKMTYDVQEPHRKVHHMPGTWKVTTNHRDYSGASSFPMAHIGNRHILLEKNGLSNSSRCLLKTLPSEEIGKFYICSCLCKTSYNCNKIRPSPHYQE